MRKQLIILFTVLLAVFLAIGCTSTDTEDQATENQTPVEEPTTEPTTEEETTTEPTTEEEMMEDESMEEEEMMENESMEEEEMMENESMEEEDTMESEETIVEISEDGFDPSDAQITAGDTVTWMNNDSIAHTIIDDEGVFDSEEIEPGESYSYTFDEAGTYTYTSSEDETFEGMITVATSVDESTNGENITGDNEVVVVPADA